MILITTIARSVVVSFDEFDNRPVEINIEGERMKKELKTKDTDLIKIPMENGKYKITVKKGSAVCTKTVFIH